jgi:hypothetical protein
MNNLLWDVIDPEEMRRQGSFAEGTIEFRIGGNHRDSSAIAAALCAAAWPLIFFNVSSLCRINADVIFAISCVRLGD